MTINDVEDFLRLCESSNYSRSNYDLFLKDINFSFTKKAIHVTGTNGKGSIVEYLSQVLINAGYKVGSFTSPIYEKYHEYITVNNSFIGDDRIVFYFEKYKDSFVKYHLTSFEIMTFICLTYFNEINLDLAIIEVGMGGLIDATNVFVPILSIISNVEIDHKSYLGETLTSIARHKAGIIKEGVNVLIGDLNSEALLVIKEAAAVKNAKIFDSSMNFVDVVYNPLGNSFTYNEERYNVGISAYYELENLKIVFKALQIISSEFPVSISDIKPALETVRIRGRFNIISNEPLIIIDGAHNYKGTQKLIEGILKFNLNKKLNVLFAGFKDKEVEKELDLYGLVNANIITTSWNHKRARTKNDYPEDVEFIDDYQSAFKRLMEFEDGVYLITGSLNFAFFMSEYLKKGFQSL